MRSLLIFFGILQLLGSVAAGDDSDLEFPENFLIGVATSAYQVEGAWNFSDKGEGTWDRLAHTQPERLNGDTGDVACDSFHKYKEDVQLVKSLGVDYYRFSLSWSRILPTGRPDIISETGVEYYKNLIDELLANGIEPFVTIFHFDDVQSLYEETGGWINETMVEYFADYARVAFREFGDKVKFWTTYNEINIYCSLQPFVQEPAAPAYSARYQCAHNALKAHARAYHIYNDEFRASQKGKVGVIAAGAYYYPESPQDMDVTDVGFAFETGWIMHPIFSETGGYPDIMVQRIAENSKVEGLETSRLPEFSPHWIHYIKGTADYFGFNHYTSHMAERALMINGTWFNDSGFIKKINPTWAKAANGWMIAPQGLSDLLRKIKDEFGNPPVYILENGYNGVEEIDDQGRISYLYSYMKEVLAAIRDGCDVRSYTIWSLMDNLEWTRGYAVRFGLHQIDFNDPDRKRIPRASAHWLARVMAARKLIPPEGNQLTEQD